MLVEKSIYNEAIEKIRKYTNELKVGVPYIDGNHIGPVVYYQMF